MSQSPYEQLVYLFAFFLGSVLAVNLIAGLATWVMRRRRRT